MRASDRQFARDLRGPLIAAAMVARDARLSVRVVIPHASEQVRHAEEAAEQAGVDVAVERTTACVTVHFIARHQDRRLAPGAVRGQTLRSILRAVPPGRRAGAGARPLGPQHEAAPPALALIDLVAFRRASDALALNQAQDAEAELIWHRLLRARARAHVCGGMPTLIVNDVGGLVGLLRRRARNRGAALRINPDACACG